MSRRLECAGGVRAWALGTRPAGGKEARHAGSPHSGFPGIGVLRRMRFQALEARLRGSAVRAAALLAVAGTAAAHPFDAARAPHPVVPSFDLLVASAASDEQLAPGGLLLLAELNCTGCHAAPEPWSEQLSPVPSRSLAGVGSRLHADALRKFVGDPQGHKGGTRMPGLFGESGAEAARVQALADYLGTLTEPVPPAPAGDAARGGILYHSVGCVACHAPSAGVRPAGVAAGQDPVAPANASVPLTLAGDYDVNALAHFLRDPLRHRPGGRMPDFHLAEQEAADLAVYLRGGAPAGQPPERPRPDPARVEQGKRQFIESGCSACHDVGEKPPPPAAKPLEDLEADGCLSAARKAGVPYFGLGDTQRRAIRTALRVVRAGPPAARSARQEAGWQLARLNCHACHARDGLGGPDSGRAQYFGVNDSTAESFGEMARIPPKLDRTGRKLTHGWLEKVLWGSDGAVRPYMNTRMPSFGRAQTEPLIAWLGEADRLEKPVEMDVSGMKGHQRAEIGRKLLGIGGLACVSCHGIRDRKALGPLVVRLTHTVERLRPEYFKELLLNPQVTQPGTVMPPLMLGRKTADKDIESIWTYLKELGAHPMPEGLASEGDYELKPVSAGRPMVFRSFIEGAGTHAVGVGFPQGLNAAFDAKACRWTVIWKGRFLDAFSNFQDRPMKPIRPLGTDVKVLAFEPGARGFRGYRLEKDGTPVMLYSENGRSMEDSLRPAADGQSFERVVTVDGKPRKEVVSW